VSGGSLVLEQQGGDAATWSGRRSGTDMTTCRLSKHAAPAATAIMIGERIADFIKTNARPIMGQPIEEYAK
jgi:hypothetical protein